MKKWTSLAAAAVLAAALAVDPMALTLPQEPQTREADAAETAQASPEDTGETDQALEAPEASPESALLNALTPGEAQPPSSPALDKLVLSLMDGFLTDEMTTYDKVRACYDYVIAHTSYGNHMAYMSTPLGGGTCWDVYQSYGEVEGFGAVALTAGKGMCNAYASAFILMARRLGLEARLVKGYTISGGGSYAYHEWAEIIIDGTPYVFDPQLDQDLAKSGLPAYSAFCKSYDALGTRYKR